MKLAQIVPPEWSQLYPQGEYRMVLAHWVLRYPQYVLETRRAGSGGYIIVDNGQFEGAQLDLDDLNKACLKVNADEVVLPDALGNSRQTLSQSWAALGKLKTERVMFVPQGTSQEERLKCLEAWVKKWELSKFKDHYALAIGITSLRKDPEKRLPKLGTREGILGSIADLGLEYPVHLLGVPNPGEFVRTEAVVARKLNVRGVDTSIAFALGAEGKLLTPSQPKVHLKAPEEYESLNTHRRRLILLNQRILVEWVEREADECIPTHWIRQTASKWFKYWAEGFADLDKVMAACGMPKGRYALLKQRGQRRREKYVRPLKRGEKLREHESEVRI